ncbi:MAG: prepilin-type N-terminal cleavage/methylation domain-containing protein [Prosthecobacter sp.]
MKRASAAFTLLEMIVVLAIAALIIGIGAAAVGSMDGEHEMRRTAREAEGVFLKAMASTLTTSMPQMVNLEDLQDGMKLTVRRAGTDVFVSALEQRLYLRPGGLCEPLTLRWQKESAWITATLDPLTGGFAEMEENL